MKVGVRFISLPNIPLKRTWLEIDDDEGLTFGGVLDRLSREVGVDFIAGSDSYMYVLNSVFVSIKDLNCTAICDGDTIIIMPFISGG